MQTKNEESGDANHKLIYLIQDRVIIIPNSSSLEVGHSSIITSLLSGTVATDPGSQYLPAAT
jgi:hypothetical protein